MFNFLKNLKELNEVNKIISSEVIEVEKEGIKVKINGKMEIEEIVLNPSISIEKQQKILKDCINDGVRKIQLKLMGKLSNKGFGV
ncbi:MAG: hypothetical protein N2643_05380 [Endomicrobia bacterium]|nr:hypothetical protein [Endomicrobiia bacterium]